MALDDNGERFSEFVERLAAANTAFQALLPEVGQATKPILLPASLHEDLGPKPPVVGVVPGVARRGSLCSTPERFLAPCHPPRHRRVADLDRVVPQA